MRTDPPGSPIEFSLNGKPFSARIDHGESLMDVLRDQAGLISPKNGCAPQGSCGCCTVLVNGRALSSCAVPAGKVAGGTVVTLEGLPPRERHVFAKAFSVAGGLQCGFCIPGIVMSAKRLIDRTPVPTRADIAHALNNHICRCTGYVKIIDAIDLAARALQGAPLPEPDWSGKVGTSLPRMDGEAFVLGERPYIDDMSVPGLLYGAFVFSPNARARVIRIDTTDAASMPGVVHCVTAADVPGQRYQGLIYKDWPVFVAEGEITHCIGDMLACVVATSDREARAAARRVSVAVEELPGVFTPEEALEDGAPRVHHDHENLLSTSVVRRGDAGKALAESAHVETRTFTTQVIEHAFLEPESCLAIPSPLSGHDGGSPAPGHESSAASLQPALSEAGRVEGSPAASRQPPAASRQSPAASRQSPAASRIHVFSPGQGVFDDRTQIASCLGLPVEQVQVTLVSNGGAFGGKEDLSIQAQVALMAYLTGRPVKATLNREESIRLHPKRHAMKLTYTVGCDREGRLTAIRARIVGDKGAFASVGTKVLERAAGHAGGPYRVPNVDVEALSVYTNNLPCGAMRGFGANQAAFALESMIDILAERTGVDPWEIRWRNAVDVGDTFATGQVFDESVGIKPTLLAVKEAFYSSRYAGIACGIKNVGIGNGMPEYGHALIEVHDDERLTIHTGFTEMGQGFYTAMIQCLCDIAPVDPRQVRVEVDTSFPTPCGMTTASRATVLGGRAVQRAAGQLRRDLDGGESLKDLAGRRVLRRVRASITRRRSAPRSRSPSRTSPTDSRRRSASSTSMDTSPGSSRRTTSAASSIASCSKGRSRGRSTWASDTR